MKLRKYWLMFDGAIMVAIGYFCHSDPFGAVGFGLLFIALSLSDKGAT